MTKKDYALLASSVHRTLMCANMEKNQIKRLAKLATLNLLVTDMSATLRHDNERFNEDKFKQACGV